jgi:hypothetical protein
MLLNGTDVIQDSEIENVEQLKNTMKIIQTLTSRVYNYISKHPIINE